MVRVVVPNADVAEKLAEIERAAFAGRDTPWNPEDYMEIGGPPHAAILTDDDVAEGLLVLQFAADEAEVLNLGVIPEARRAGLGRSLLADGIVLAQALGMSRMFLEVATDNVAARSLYGSAGFQEVGRRARYYLRPDDTRVDALILAKDL